MVQMAMPAVFSADWLRGNLKPKKRPPIEKYQPPATIRVRVGRIRQTRRR